MRIAFISFEYPPAVAIGGIGTYVKNAAAMLVSKGHEVEVFAAGDTRTSENVSPGVVVHRFAACNRRDFAGMIPAFFVQVHSVRPFDVMEVPDIGPESDLVREALPNLARVSKLHTPTFLVSRYGYDAPGVFEQLRFSLGALRRGTFRRLGKNCYDRLSDREFLEVSHADDVAAPSRAIADAMTQDWDIPDHLISLFPLPFVAEQSLLEIPKLSKVNVIGFLGRLEPRKGIVELTKAIPEVLKQFPDVRFRFIGPSWPMKSTDCQAWMLGQLKPFSERLDFVGSVTPDMVAAELAKCDVIALPSRWESFGYVCAEAMAAGRAVIGSSAGGMAEMIEHRKTGLLVPPRNPAAIAASILELVRNPARAIRMAIAGRTSIQELLNPDRIYPLQMASYQRAIDRAKTRSAAN